MKSFRLYLALAMSCAAGGLAHAEISGDVVRVGVLNDVSGIFQDTNGMGSVEAAKMAAEDFNGGGKRYQDDVPGILDGKLRSHRQGLLTEHHPMGQ
jgi:branched-chain amino acid transport system substrate-binding protein